MGCLESQDPTWCQTLLTKVGLGTPLPHSARAPSPHSCPGEDIWCSAPAVTWVTTPAVGTSGGRGQSVLSAVSVRRSGQRTVISEPLASIALSAPAHHRRAPAVPTQWLLWPLPPGRVRPGWDCVTGSERKSLEKEQQR